MEEQLDKIIVLLNDISNKLDNIYYNMPDGMKMTNDLKKGMDEIKREITREIRNLPR